MKGLVLRKEYPAVLRHRAYDFFKLSLEEVERATGNKGSEVTITNKRVQAKPRGLHTKMYFDNIDYKRMNSSAWELLVRVGREMAYEDCMIVLTQETSGMSRRAYKEGLDVLKELQILIPIGRYGKYWVDVTVMLKGTINWEESFVPEVFGEE